LIDINAPYYPDYAGGAFRDHPYGRSPLDGSQLGRLKELTGVDVLRPPSMCQVSFTRPEISPCLAKLADSDSARYREALAIIQAGRKRLARDPRPDMPSFRHVSSIEMEQERRYQAQLELERAMRDAIARGARRYQGEADLETGR
jgi:hypothetical protein